MNDKLSKPESGTEEPDRKALMRNALTTIDRLQSRIRELERAPREAIAVVGMGCRYPGGADSPDAFWRLLMEGFDAVGPVPPERWDADAFTDPDPSAPGKMTSPFGGFLRDLDRFDPAFFGISPREARDLDPQQRLMLEVSWEALENAGIAAGDLRGSMTGMFAAVTMNDYARMALNGDLENLSAYTATGGALNAVAGRISYTLGLHGPCMCVDTACSSSLTALHVACQSLRLSECDMAMAGGVNVALVPEPFICFAKWGMMAPDGLCKVFDEKADGFVRSEGCGVVVLKRLSDAQKAGDRILAIIRGSAINQDGPSSGMTVPNGRAQQSLIKTALEAAGMKTADIDYVETHGTGTAIGDPIELEALAAVYGKDRPAASPLIVGSVKTNIGHAESAAGMAGLIKTILSLQHESIPAHKHFERLSSKISLRGAPIEIPTSARPWKRQSERKRRAAVSAFGFSGSNAHIIIEEAPLEKAETGAPMRAFSTLTLSAKSSEALRALAGRWRDYLATQRDEDFADACHTSNTGRTHFTHRLALVAASSGEAGRILDDWLDGKNPVEALAARSQPAEKRKIAFLFTGQGSQSVNMGRGLYESQPVFRARMNECDGFLRPILGESILSIMYPEAGCKEEATERLNQTRFAQPALFALEYSLASMWRSWGIEPEIALGHSVGEYVAACVAGVFDLGTGLRLIARRAELMQSLPEGGSMAAVMADEKSVEQVVREIGDELSVAAVNGPENTVISGRREAVEAAIAAFAARGVEAKPLRVSHAFHSPLMRPMLGAFERELGTVDFQATDFPLISNLSGGVGVDEDFRKPDYWLRHIMSPVRFSDSIAALEGLGVQSFLEIGPHPVLLGMGRACAKNPEGASWLPSLRRDQDEWRETLASLARLYVNGAAVRWSGVNEGTAGRRVSAPTYPYQRESYWQAKPKGSRRESQRGEHPILGGRIDLASDEGVHVWQNDLDLDRQAWILDHQVQGLSIAPATLYMDMVFSAMRELGGDGTVILRNIELLKSLAPTKELGFVLQAVLNSGREDWMDFSIFSRLVKSSEEKNATRPAATTPWTLHARGASKLDKMPPASQFEEAFDAAAIQARCAEELSKERFYQHMHERGNEWMDAFQGVSHVWRREGEALSLIEVPKALLPSLSKFQFHPAVADASGHVITATIALAKSDDAMGGAMVGGGVEETRLYAPARSARYWAHARLRPESADEKGVLVGDVRILDMDGVLISESIGVRLWYLDRAQSRDLLERTSDWFYETVWERVDPPDGSSAVARPGERWLILADKGGVGEMLGARINHLGGEATIIRSDSSLGLESSLEKILSEGKAPDRIIHLWSLDSAETQELNPERLDKSALLGCGTLLRLVRVLSSKPELGHPIVWTMTRDSQPVKPDDRLSGAAQSVVWGFARTMAIEHSEYWGGLIDLDAKETPDEMAERILLELSIEDREDQTAWRDGSRFALRLKACGDSTREEASTRLRRDASYLISGGTGGIGLVIADWLAERGAGNIVLAQRSAFPDREKWNDFAQDSIEGKKIAAIRAMEANGARVEVESVDVGDAEQWGAFLERRTREGKPPFRGVVHAAGLMQYEPFLEQSEDTIRRFFQAKVMGAWNLHESLKDSHLDFFLLFSSSSALLSSPLMASYSAANCFLDALAHWRRSIGLPATSVNWGTWSEVGMATQFDGGERQGGLRGVGTISNARGVEAAHILLGSGRAQTAVMPIRWDEWRSLYPAFLETPFLSNFRERGRADGKEEATDIREKMASALPEERHGLLLERLGLVVGRIMKQPAEKLDLDTPLLHLGFDSLMAVELKNQIESDLGNGPAMARLLQGPSVRKLADIVLETVKWDAASAGKPESQAELEEGEL
jgi:acyl transferase domain-containing protein/acyl carrier protein